MTGLILLVSFAAIVGWGSASSALRDPPAISYIKIVFACVMLLGLFAALAGARWFAGEEDLSGITLLVWPLAATGMVVCLCSITGRLFGIYRRGSRS